MKLYSVIILCSVLPFAACMNTRPVRDAARFYLLSPSAGSVETVQSEHLIGVREVELPGYLSAHKIALRQKGSEIVYKNFELWGEPLDESVTRTLAGRMAARIGRERVDVFPWTNGISHDVEVRVQFDHFEGSVDGSVLVSGRYIISPAAGKTGDTSVVPFDYQGKWGKNDYSSLANILGDELDRLAAEILSRTARAERP